jgi:YD repeat-containing protein
VRSSLGESIAIGARGAVLLVGLFIGACSRCAPTPTVHEGPGVSLDAASPVPTESGCDPDGQPVEDCFLVPMTDNLQALRFATGSWKKLRARLVERGIERVDIDRGDVVRPGVETLLFDGAGRLIRDEEGETIRTVDYDPRGFITHVHITYRGLLWLDQYAAGAPDRCGVTEKRDGSGPGGTPNMECWVEGDHVFRKGPWGLVRGDVRSDRTVYDTGSFVARDAEGRMTELDDSHGHMEFTYDAKGVHGFDLLDGGKVRRWDMPLNAEGLPAKRELLHEEASYVFRYSKR